VKVGALVRLGIFIVVAGFFAVMEFNTLTGPHVGTTDTYYAIFGGPDGVSGLRTGNPVRVAGVAVGKVTSVELVDARHAKVAFTANRNQTLTNRTNAIVRYANLLGQRYLALTLGSHGPAGPLAPGATIPDSRTAPALSLTDLFNGFRPLFSALTPDQVNELSQDIIDVLQGQGARLQDLVARTADLTSNFAQRDQTFSKVLDSLTLLLDTVAKHDNELADMVTSLHGLTDQLHREGPAIMGSLDGVDQLIGSVSNLFQNLDQHHLPRDIADAAAITKVLASNTPTVEQLVSGFAKAFKTFARVSQNGNWFNVYICNITVRTAGQLTSRVSDMIAAIGHGIDIAAPGLGLGQVVGSVLGGLGIGGTLDSIPGLDVPVTLPTGYAGAHTQTKVCS
jgi:phospholipid/cholesterol/gamma-HCH transport system substrate-binding protein